MTATTGELLKAARTRAGLSLNAVARRSGVGQPALWQWEHSLRDPRVSTLLRVAKGLDVEPAALLPAAEALPPSSRGHVLAAARRIARTTRYLDVLGDAGVLTMLALVDDELRAALGAGEQAP